MVSRQTRAQPAISLLRPLNEQVGLKQECRHSVALWATSSQKPFNAFRSRIGIIERTTEARESKMRTVKFSESCRMLLPAGVVLATPSSRRAAVLGNDLLFPTLD